MKRIIILAVVLFAAVTFNAEAKRHYNGVGGYFYTQLSPYGSWIEIDYGVVVWRPTIIRVNWMPYQMGRWVWTYDGWYWDSYEPFGFITYHYGRWFYDDYYGWLWYPDYEWAPAWVEWRYDNDYIGWAPLHPYAVFSVSLGIHWTRAYYTPYHHWHFVGYRNFCDPYVYNYYVGSGYKYKIHGNTKYRTNYVYYNGRVQNRGVDTKYISVRSGQEIRQRDIIRVRDSNELRRDDSGRRDEIRTLDLKKDELVRNDLGRMEIKKENRRTSLEMDKVQIGRRENITTEKREDKSINRNPDTRKESQTRNNEKDAVDKVFDRNRIETKRESDNTQNRQKENVEVRKRETGKINEQRESTRKTNEVKNRNDNQVKDQNRNKTSESPNLNRQKQEQRTEVKQESRNNEQVKRNEVKQESRNNVQQNRKDENRVNNERKVDENNSRERSRR
jgi:hypothetical protein